LEKWVNNGAQAVFNSSTNFKSFKGCPWLQSLLHSWEMIVSLLLQLTRELVCHSHPSKC
jgi:hypothetical protein